MVVLLVVSRRANVPFPYAWKQAMKRLSWPHATEDRRGWKLALNETREEWQACYERVDETVLRVLADASLPPVVS